LNAEKKERWEGFLDSVLLSYSQIFFCRDRRVGVILMAATAVHPPLFLGGLIAVLLINAFAVSLHLSREAIGAGMLGYNALLIGLAFPALFRINVQVIVLFVLAVLATALISAALHAALGYYFNLPVLTLPFLIVMYLILAAFPNIQGMAANTQWNALSQLAFSLPKLVEGYFKSLGAIFFSPNVVSGIILFLGLLYYSRVAIALSLLGYTIGITLIRWVFKFPPEHIYLSIGFNFILTAIAMGGVWFVPQGSAFLFAGSAVLLCAVILAGASNLLSFFGLPILILPFNLTVLTLLYGMRQRTVDRRPKSVDFISGTPEENLTYYLTRVNRFGAQFANRIGLPFLGAWTCTQGNRGKFTHLGLWEQAFDFEVQDPAGRFYINAGASPSDYLCYKLPVLACGDGQIVKTVGNVPDSPIGKPNLRQNWGNLVLIQHGLTLYSMVSHLAEGSLKVREGEFVKKGAIIGLCGSSGRAAVPHLHFQLQGTPRVGSPTIPSEFHEVIVERESPVLHSTYLPREGDRLRNVRVQQEMGDFFSLAIGQNMGFRCRLQDRVWDEEIESGIDLYGNLKLLSPGKRAMLFFENKNSVFVIYDYQGPRESALFVLYTAAPRVPFEWVENLTYSDTLPRRHFLSWMERIPSDFFSPFSNHEGMKIQYRMERRGCDLVVLGSSAVPGEALNPALITQAVFKEGAGWAGGHIIQNGRKLDAARK
jgi:urea transporter